MCDLDVNEVFERSNTSSKNMQLKCGSRVCSRISDSSFLPGERWGSQAGVVLQHSADLSHIFFLHTVFLRPPAHNWVVYCFIISALVK